jgi:hypothetical protein
LAKFLLFLYLLITSVTNAYSWGFYAHKKINRMAVYALPQPLLKFYRDNIEFVTEHAVDADKRRYVDSNEGQRHFIDIDHYGVRTFATMPKYWYDAIARYSEDTLKKYGTLPYEIMYWEIKLTTAFEKKDKDAILWASANIGHYIADAHVPLHTITNYNGQFTEQVGIHALWESAIPELYGDNYAKINGGAKYLPEPAIVIWSILQATNHLAPMVLLDEKIVAKNFPGKAKYLNEESKEMKKKFAPDYVAAYNKQLNGMVERQLHSSAMDVADFWLTAWVNAGQPDIGKLK